ncbi:flavocytochrome c [Sutterella sp.]|uniref:flavocytochrome c n=1 Tax=Sutterella sp. TaxID=1981025 RepID=UPI0026DEBA49|nr:flavocytochrome c [Sutterella sp.]MDO5532312.1 flavocytochrome c [Sutterella sp.]
MSTEISRRKLFGAATAAAVGSFSFVKTVSAAEAKDINWNETKKFVIVGTGFAGLAAALEAQSLGMKADEILVLDKMPVPGGNSIINGGAVAAAGTDMQEKEGIKDSPDVLYRDILKAGGGLAHPELARRIADECVENFYWLRDKIGVQFKAVTYHGGHSVRRSHAVTNNSGSGFINPMLAKLKELGIQPRLRCIVDQIIVSDKGCVLGVKVRNNYRFGRENSGKEAYIRATNGVLLAAGGFSQNVQMRMSHDPRLTDAFTSTNHPGATGEMIQEAQEIGANTIQMDWIQLGPWTSPDESGFGVAPLFVESAVGYGPMVDPATGKRFIMETGNRKVRADAIVAIGHPCVIYTSLENAEAVIIGKNMTQEIYERSLKNGVVKKYDNLKAMADDLKIPYEQLLKTHETFNGYMAAKKDPDFNCMFFDNSKPIDPNKTILACRLWPRVHHCMGGLEINNNSEVLSVRGKPIPGLYAAGEITGGVHGMVRLGTVAVADCMIFGRVAARSAAKFKGC